MKSHRNHVVIPIFIPHKGCPFDCIFCNQKLISGQIEEMTIMKMRSIIEEHLSTVRSNSFIQIGFYGGSFTGIPILQQTSYLECAYEYIEAGKVNSIRLSTRPDYINEEILNNLKKYKTQAIELGVQSMDELVLKTCCRGHTKDHVYEASRLIKEFGFELGIQTMVGLPDDTNEKAILTAKEVVKINPDIVRIYPALVIRGTFMEKLYCDKKYIPLGLENAVELCAELMDIYDANGIDVIRVGLQATESINNNMDVVAGPFHPAFRQLVESKRILTKIILKLDEFKKIEGETLCIVTEKANISNVIGQRSSNINYIKEKYGFKNIRVTHLENMTECQKIIII